MHNEDDGKCGVYFLYDTNNGRAYVGSTANVERRIAVHEKELNTGTHKNTHLLRAARRGDNFEVSFIPTRTRDEAFDFEQSIIDEFKDSGLLFNMSTNARYCSIEATPSEETRKKMSEWQLGKKHSPETLAKLKEKAEGRQPTAQAHEAALQANLGRKMPKTTSDAIMAKLSKPVRVDEVVFPSLSAAGRASGIDSSTAHNRVNSPNFPNWQYVVTE